MSLLVVRGNRLEATEGDENFKFQLDIKMKLVLTWSLNLPK
jgi:hypothetical protein